MTPASPARVCLGTAPKAGRRRHVLRREGCSGFFPSVLPLVLMAERQQLAKAACLQPTMTTGPTSPLPAPGGSRGSGGCGGRGPSWCYLL